MKKIANSWHIELAIGILLEKEETLETKLDLLTSIGITSTNSETFRICEKIRDNLSNDNSEMVQVNREKLRESVRGEIIPDGNNGSPGISQFNESP